MRKKLGWLALACGVAAASCGSPAAFAATAAKTSPTVRAGMAGASVENNNKDIEKVIADGMRYLGTPYEFDSNRSTDKTFDCSDFVKWIYGETLGIDLPYNSREQGAYIKQKGDVVTDWHKLKRGDLMFFMSYHGSSASDYKGIDKSTARITHVALYLGDGKVLQTYSVNSGGVRVDSIEGTHFDYRFLFGGSVV
ncbi:NlpC/P60 family protein [Cohnella zeiphila]|uniref:C40 family peptidase n=1 Tax=Cohnella zeiphila TaxID=2761120 RepID=A0A7X0SRL1_9BACL|nr:C40 family peptidase [Cohnella zeiphila]